MTHKKGHSKSDELLEAIVKSIAAPATTAAGQPRYDDQGNRIGYVGVDDNYLATRRPTPMQGIRRPDSLDPTSEQVTPFYPAGSEDSLSNMGADDIGRIQGELVKAGLLSKGTSIRYRSADESTIAAYKKLLAYANQNGLTQTEALSELQSAPESKIEDLMGGGASEDKSGTRSTTDVNEAMFTDPATARDTLRTAMETRLGRAATADEEARFRAALRQEEAGDSVSTRTTTYGRKGNPKSSYTSQADDTTDASASTVADDFTRTGKLGREANTRMTGVDYYGAILSLPGMGG